MTKVSITEIKFDRNCLMSDKEEKEGNKFAINPIEMTGLIALD